MGAGHVEGSPTWSPEPPRCRKIKFGTTLTHIRRRTTRI